MKALAINTSPLVSKGLVAFSCLCFSTFWEGQEVGGEHGAGSGDAGGSSSLPGQPSAHGLRHKAEPCSTYRCLSRLISLCWLFAQEEGEVAAVVSW